MTLELLEPRRSSWCFCTILQSCFHRRIWTCWLQHPHSSRLSCRLRWQLPASPHAWVVWRTYVWSCSRHVTAPSLEVKCPYMSTTSVCWSFGLSFHLPRWSWSTAWRLYPCPGSGCSSHHRWSLSSCEFQQRWQQRKVWSFRFVKSCLRPHGSCQALAEQYYYRS